MPRELGVKRPTRLASARSCAGGGSWLPAAARCTSVAMFDAACDCSTGSLSEEIA